MMSSRGEEKIYVVQSSAKVISRCILMATDLGDLVLDPLTPPARLTPLGGYPLKAGHHYTTMVSGF